MRYFVVDLKSQKFGIPKKSRGQYIAQYFYIMLLECTTVVRWFWNLLGTLSYVLTITLAYHIEGLVFELSRTKDMSSIQFTGPLNQISELTKNIRVENNRMPYFRPSSIEFGHRTKWNSLQKTRMKLNRPVDLALKQPRRYKVLFLSLQSNLYITALY